MAPASKGKGLGRNSNAGQMWGRGEDEFTLCLWVGVAAVCINMLSGISWPPNQV